LGREAEEAVVVRRERRKVLACIFWRLVELLWEESLGMEKKV
jgi:hypothetical protein